MSKIESLTLEEGLSLTVERTLSLRSRKASPYVEASLIYCFLPV